VARLAVAWCTLFVIGTDLFVVSPLLPLIASDLRLAPASAGLSVTAFAAAYMICAPLLGHLADRIGRRPMLSWGLAGFAIANLLTAAAPNLWLLLAARIVAGVTTAAVSPSIYALVGDSAPPARRATWMAAAVSGLLMSLSAGAPLGALAGAALGWAKVFDGLAGLALVLLLVNRRIWPREAAVAASGAIPREKASAGVLARRLLPTVIWATALYGMYTYLGTWLARAGFSTGEIAQVITFYGAGALAGTFAGGRIADRLGPATATGISLLGLFACFALLPFVLHPGWPICLGFAILSAVAQIFFPAQQAGLVGDFPARRATVLAWNNSSLFLGIACGSLVGGQAVTYGSFPASLAVCAAIALAGWVANRIATAGRRAAAA
jgi:MFS transporter, DHA1 family, putative efflux transporter